MAEDPSEESKPHEPTRRKLEKAREKGDIPRSTDVTSATAYAGLLLALVALGGQVATGIGTLGSVLVGQSDALAGLFFGASGAPATGAVLRTTLVSVAPVFVAPAVLVLAVLVAQKGIVFAPEKLVPKLSRISPVANAKQKFGLSGVFEFAKSFVKLVVFSIAVVLYLSHRTDDLVTSTTQDASQSALAVGQMAAEFLGIVVVIAALIAAVDWLWQIAEHKRRNRMSHKELRDEMKETEGDPMLKDKRRQRGMSIAQNAMLADVPQASVVIVNPTHYAVALKWETGDAGAPVCLAKGVDEIALRIREAAEAAGVPLRHDPPTARALHATVEIGEEIATDHYGPVAAAIRFAEALRAKKRRSIL